MSSEILTGSREHEIGHAREHAHPGDRTYVMIAVILAVITAVEVATFYVDIGDLFIPSLMVMMIAKFALVAMYFMHLRFDSNLFTRLFVSGIVLAVLVYATALMTFQFFFD